MKNQLTARLILGFVLLICATLGLDAQNAKGDVVFELTESGSDLLVTSSGSIDLAGATSFGTFTSDTSSMRPSFGLFPGEFATLYSRVGSTTAYNVTSPVGAYGNSGTSFMAAPGTGTGAFTQSLGFNGLTFYLPASYTSGADLSGTITFSNLSFADVGITAGTTGTGTLVGGQTITVQSVSAVPEPSSFFALGAVGLGLVVRRRKRNR